ncbi:hypothetical protein D3C79_1020350 [compost metagenome]
MRRYHLRPQLEGHRPHAERRLGQHHTQQQHRQAIRLAIAGMPAQRLEGEQGNHHGQGTGKIAMDHLGPALGLFHRVIGEV